MKKYFITSIPAAEYSFGREQTGDYDYTCKIAALLKQEYIDDFEVTHLGEPLAADELIREVISELEKGHETYFHLILNPPGTGMAITVDHLSTLKAYPNCKIVITIVEVEKHSNTNNYLQIFGELLTRTLFANKIIFLDEQDKNFAKVILQRLEHEIPEYADIISPERKRELTQLCYNAAVIPVPTTIPEFNIPEHERGNGILIFGIIREGKGYSYVLKLAEQIRDSYERIKPEIHIVGSVPKNVKALEKGQQLSKLLKAVYPSLISGIDDFLDSQPLSTEADLLAWFLRLQQPLVKKLPITFHFNIAAEDLAPIFRQCKFAWYPGYRGATLRNSSFSSLLANDFITFSHIGKSTPSVLRINGRYDKAINLCPEIFFSYQEYSSWVLRSINSILNLDADKQSEMIANQRRVYTELLSDTQIVKGHRQSIMQVNELNESTAIGIVQQKYRANTSERKIKNASGVDVSDVALQGNHLKLLAQFKGENALSKDEIKLLDQMLRCKWSIQHISSAGDDIIKSQKILSGDALVAYGLGRPEHTPGNLGQTSLVFLSLSPSYQPPPPEFLSAGVNNTGFYFDYEQAVKHWPDAYISGHWYAFQERQDQAPIRIGNTLIMVRYRFERDIRDAVKYLDIIDLTTNARKTIAISLVDEMFKLKHAALSLTLKFIQIIRCFDEQTRNKLLNPPLGSNSTNPVRVFEQIFHAGYLEIHKPWMIKLENWATHRLIPQDSKVIKALLAKMEPKQILQIILANPDFATDTQPRNIGDQDSSIILKFSPLSAAVLGGHFAQIDQFLSEKSDIHFTLSIKNRSLSNQTEEQKLSPFFAILCLVSPKLVDFVNANLGYDAIKVNPELAGRLFEHFIAKNNQINFITDGKFFYPRIEDLLCALAIADDLPDEWVMKYLNSPARIVDYIPLSLFALQSYNRVIENCLANNYENIEQINEAVSKQTKQYSLFMKIYMLINQQNPKLAKLKNLRIHDIPLVPLVTAVIGDNKELFKLLAKFSIDLNIRSAVFKHGFVEGISSKWDHVSAIEAAALMQNTEMLEYLQQEHKLNLEPSFLQEQELIVSVNMLFLALMISDAEGKAYFIEHAGVVGQLFVPKDYVGMPIFWLPEECSKEMIAEKINSILGDESKVGIDDFETHSAGMQHNELEVAFNLAVINIEGLSKSSISMIGKRSKLRPISNVSSGIHQLSAQVWLNMLDPKYNNKDLLERNGPHTAIEYRLSTAILLNDLFAIRHMIESEYFNKDNPVAYVFEGLGSTDGLLLKCILHAKWEVAKLLLSYGFALPVVYSPEFELLLETKNHAGVKFIIKNSKDENLGYDLSIRFISLDKNDFSYLPQMIIEHAIEYGYLDNSTIDFDCVREALSECTNLTLLRSKILTKQNNYSMLRVLDSIELTLIHSNDLAKFLYYLEALKMIKPFFTDKNDQNSFNSKLISCAFLANKFNFSMQNIWEIFDQEFKQQFLKNLLHHLCESCYAKGQLSEWVNFDHMYAILNKIWHKTGSDLMSNVLLDYICEFQYYLLSADNSGKPATLRFLEFSISVFGSASIPARKEMQAKIRREISDFGGEFSTATKKRIISHLDTGNQLEPYFDYAAGFINRQRLVL